LAFSLSQTIGTILLKLVWRNHTDYYKLQFFLRFILHIRLFRSLSSKWRRPEFFRSFEELIWQKMTLRLLFYYWDHISINRNKYLLHLFIRSQNITVVKWRILNFCTRKSKILSLVVLINARLLVSELIQSYVFFYFPYLDIRICLLVRSPVALPILETISLGHNCSEIRLGQGPWPVARLAQLEDQWTGVPKVMGSSPTPGTNIFLPNVTTGVRSNSEEVPG